MQDDSNQPKTSALTLIGIPAFAFAFLAAAQVLAQPAEFDPGSWDRRAVYMGWSAVTLLDEAEVFDRYDDEIGTVENLLIDDQGQIVALVVQAGGAWDIGDTHLAIPWEEATFRGFDVRVPVNEDAIERYSLLDDDLFTERDVGSLETVADDLATGYDIWKATDLVNDYAVLETGAGYGYVTDLIFDDGGMLQAIVVNSEDRGHYAYPWYGRGYTGYAWNPGLDSYVLPFDEDEISEIATAFAYEPSQSDGTPRSERSPGE